MLLDIDSFMTSKSTFNSFISEKSFSIFDSKSDIFEQIQASFLQRLNLIILSLDILYLYKLAHIERETGKRIWNILQLRLHPSILTLREKIRNGPSDKIYEVDLTYLTSRGNWYFSSWKGDASKSGGIGTNIGIHFFDMLVWIFGGVKQNVIHLHQPDKAAGFLDLENARVRWLLSIDSDDLPTAVKEKGHRTFRSITIENEELEFSNGLMDLHTKSYEKILSGEGFGIEETRQAIEIVHTVRSQTPIGLKGDFHPMAGKYRS